MSLFIGNLSSRVHQDDLESVFQKFGFCNLQVKDKFGFVHYDYPVNAEKALKMLRGKRICGQLLTLSWSNKQPKPSPKPRGLNFHRSHHGRNSHESNHKRNLGESRHRKNLPESQHEKNLHESQHGRNLRESQHGRNLPKSQLGRNNRKQRYVKNKLPSEGQMGYKKLVPDGRVFRPTDKPEDVRSCDFESYGMKEKKADAKGKEPLYNLLPNGNKLGNCSEFGRYEPDSSDHKRDHGDHRSQGRGNDKMKRIRESQSSESQSPERLRASKSRKTISSSSRSDDKVSRSKSNSIYSKSTTKFASNSNSKSRSVSSSSTFSSKSGSRSRSCSRATKSHNGKNNSFTSSERNEVQIRSAPLVENGNEVLQSQKSEKDTRLPENEYLQICNFNIAKVYSKSHKTMKSLCMTSEEILMVLKHYGLKQPEGVIDKDLHVESFFGCARLWPSDVVYYRRLKKGYISTENYARRIFQNKEFGIVDKYVRSSSGWGEDTCTW